MRLTTLSHIECLFQSFSKVQENPWTGDQQDGSAG